MDAQGESSRESSRPYAVVSTDGHCGANIDEYKPYLERRYHDEFDAWRGAFQDDGWSYLDEVPEATRSLESDELQMHIAPTSFLSPVNWDSDLRQKCVESQGIAAEVLFPNTIPPFYPSGLLTASAPRTREEYELRFAGVRAHNRWLVDFCAQVPGRRAGMAQIFVNELDDAVDEIRWVREVGLSGVAMPADHFRKLHELHRPEYDKLWAVFQELDMPVAFHGVVPSDPPSDEAGAASPAIGLFEFGTLNERPMHALIFGGVLERFPRLKVVEVEKQCSWVPGLLARMDGFWAAALQPGTSAHIFAGDAMKALTKAPSEYFKSNYHVATFLDARDVAAIDQIGYEQVMWGADFPHHEGTYPYALEALRCNFADRPESEVRAMLSTTAAGVFGLDLDLLQAVADEIGPDPAQVSEPMTEEMFPADGQFCPTFSSGWDANHNR